ncbi:MAG: YhbY family RNA-binding protein, partial [Burkholderiaceae bacterium]
MPDNSRMSSLTLTPTQRRSLRAQAHHLEPVVAIGQGGLTRA